MASKWIKRAIRACGAHFFKSRRLLSPEIEKIDVKLNNLPRELNGYRLAVVSDLHFPDFLSSSKQVITALEQEKPDCILLGGDLTNRYQSADTAEIADFLQQISTLAPCYAVAGNHERAPERFAEYRRLLQEAGIPLLCDAYAHLEKNGQGLHLYGVFDPYLPLPQDIPSPSVLLIHCPHRAVAAKDSGFSLAVCGHAHGGQVRLGKRGLFAPGQGFFAKYISGLYTVGNMKMVVSRGLGDSSLPIRIHNLPHLPIITLIKS